MGTPVQLGFSGPPVQVTPWGTVVLALLNVTVPPGPTVALVGFQ
jgi:hypothetical protein